MSAEPESLILQILRQMRAEAVTKTDLEALRTDLRGKLASKSELGSLRSELKSDIRSLRADVASDLMTMRKEFTDQIVGLRRAVVDYHTSVVGHGVLISDLEARMRRVEQHLNLSAPATG
jgi:hypothetical protein